MVSVQGGWNSRSTKEMPVTHGKLEHHNCEDHKFSHESEGLQRRKEQAAGRKTPPHHFGRKRVVLFIAMVFVWRARKKTPRERDTGIRNGTAAEEKIPKG